MLAELLIHAALRAVDVTARLAYRWLRRRLRL